MLEYIEGDIFDSPAQVIVNTVNTVGVMGKGLALAFKQRYPDMFQAYRTACEKHQLSIGKLMLFYEADHWVLLFPTKENWRNPSKPEYLEKGLMKFAACYAEKGISSVAFPRLGCGNGELDWGLVRPLMERYLKPLPIDVYIYLGREQSETPEHKEPDKTIAWLRAHAKDLSFNGVTDDIAAACAIAPYKFSAGDKIVSARYDKGVNFCVSSESEPVLVSEDALYALWDDIRRRGLIRLADKPRCATFVYALLCSLGYLSKIRILDPASEVMEDGYQINEGLGRVYIGTEDI